jgi:DNA-binding MarR family transcriptional regulator
MSAESTETSPRKAEIGAAPHQALDLSRYAEGPAGEAWVLMANLLFLHGKPRLPAIAGELGLSPPQAITLRLLGEPQPMGALAQAMHCDNSNMTGIVDRLEERGLVKRRPSAGDRRVKLIETTPAGAELREQLNRAIAQPPEPLLRLSEEDLVALRDILQRTLAE